MEQAEAVQVIDGLIKNSMLFTDSVISEMQFEPCETKGEPHFIRVNPTLANPMGDRIPCPICQP